MAIWAIDSIDIGGGFLSDLSLRFPNGLICVIGPRGSGKSTLAEAIRITLQGVPKEIPKQYADFLKANLGSSVFSLSTMSDMDRGGFTIRRTFGQTPILTAKDARSVSTIDLDQGTFLPLDVYTSLDIEAIADESLGMKRRQILDDLCAVEMEQVEAELSDHRRSLEKNAERIHTSQRKLREIAESIEELGDVDANLASLPKTGDKEGTPEFQAISKQKQHNEREAESIGLAVEQLQELSRSLPRLVAAAKSSIPSPLTQAGSANQEVLQAADTTLLSLWTAIDQFVTNVVGAIDGVENNLAKQVLLLKDKHAHQESEYLLLQHKNQEAVQQFEARVAAEKKAVACKSLQNERDQEEKALRELGEERKRIKGAFVLTRDKLSELRERVASTLQSDAGEKVRIRLQRNADSTMYQHQLGDALRGSKLKNQEDILQKILTIRPDDLALMLRESDMAEFETHTAFGKERGFKIFGALQSAFDPMELEVLPIDDRVIIELNVASEAPPNFKDASELSRGQKCTALLPILMARRDTPLLIDQPEDNLDNHFIYETVVETILRLKSHRQMIFITHNANIPVLGEAELVVVMNSDGKRGFVEKAGTVDDCRKEIIDLLEGGEEAFDLRRKRYES